MPRKFDTSALSLLYMPSLEYYFCPDTGRSNFMEVILTIVEASGCRRSFDDDRICCLYVKNSPYTPLFIVAENKYIDGSPMFRLIDVRLQNRRAIVTDDGFPLSIVIQGSGSESIKSAGLVLEQEYGGSYTGNIGYIDPVGLADGILQLDLWRSSIQEAGYVDAAAKPVNVLHMSNRYAFEEEVKIAFPRYGSGTVGPSGIK